MSGRLVRRSVSAPVLAAVLVALFIGLLAYGLANTSPDRGIDEDLGSSRASDAPGFELPVLERGRPLGTAFDDGRLSSGELRGRPFVLNFWASWCPPCRDETPLLERTWRRSRDQGVLFVGLDMQDVTSDARDFLRELDVSYPNVRDRSDEVARDWGVVALPETFFVDADGRVVGHVIGAVSERRLRSGIAAARAGRVLGSRRGGESRPTR